MATSGDDLILFSGQMAFVTTTLINPYSSKEYYLEDEEFNVNDAAYDGFAGLDTLLFTSMGDFLTIKNSFGVQLVKNVETFLAGNGGDVINLADKDITYGNVTIFGGNGDDILWSNIGSDLITGGGGNDIIEGGPGNDNLFGGDDNDQIYGGAGDDTINGDAGNDILYGGTDLGLRDIDKDFFDNVSFPDLKERTNIADLVPPGTSALGIAGDNLTLEFDATATLTFREGFAGYNNTLGVYRIAADGTIESASVLWANVKAAGLNVAHQIDLPLLEDGGAFAFFIIADGDRKNSGYSGLDITGEGHVKFVYDFGGANERAAKVSDDGTLVSVVYDDGATVRLLQGFDYHTTPRDGDNAINGDGKTHAVSGSVDEFGSNILRIGFEDLPNLGDADFEDVLFDLDINITRIDSTETGNDILNGGAGDDILYGEGGDDILIIGQGMDQAYGGAGSDTYRFDVIDSDVDTIHGFESGVGGDVLDLSAILFFNPNVGGPIENFLQLTQNGADTEIRVNQDGDIGGVFTYIAIVEGGIDATINDLISNGNLIA